MCDSVNWTALSAIATTAGTFIVGWYTWETHKLRQLSQTQVEVAQKQLQSLVAAIQPHFIFEFPHNYIMTDAKELSLTVTNAGGQARNVRAISTQVAVTIPTSVLDTGQGSRHQHWKFASTNASIDPVHSEFRFDLEFEDEHGVTRKQSFRRKDDLIAREESSQ